jgi:hypothetical protein
MCSECHCFLRKQIIHVLRDLLLSDCVTHSIVSCVLTRYSQLHTDSDAFIASIAEVIADIREPITVENQPMGKDERRQIDLKVEMPECSLCRYF